ncbi:MAG TPA: hypothetical protein VIF82_17665 [Burkholderiaceae bacterium]|jgi:hypothetical protein
MSQSDTLFAELQALGAGEFEHLNGSLAAHLRGTESLLREWGAREAVCIAGLYHAVYGTDGFNPSLVGIDMRQRIVSLLGQEAEQLAYLYGACNRRVYYPRISTESQLAFADRFTNTEYDISNEQLRDLCELILANELEIAQGSAEFRAKHGALLSKLFKRMEGLVSEAGFKTFRKVLC